MNPVTFQSHSSDSYTNNPWKRVRTMAIGMSVGGLGALAYYSHKNYTGKKLWLRSIETGAAIGLSADMFELVVDIPKNVKNEAKTKQVKNINIELFKNKDFFKSLYSGQNQNTKEFNEYQQILSDKEACNKLFQNPEILKASQEALLELNYDKIEKATKNNDVETVNQLEVLNSLLTKSLNQNKTDKNVSNTGQSQNVNFKAIWNLFHDSSETVKQKAEVAVNRYASSAAATAGVLANTGVGDTFALTIITKNMCKKVFKIYDCNGSYAAAITAATVGSVLGVNLATKGAAMFPGAGNALNATITYSLHQLEGRALIEFLEENADDLDGLSDVDAVSKFAYRVKQGVQFVKNDKVRDVLEKIIDKSFDIFL